MDSAYDLPPLPQEFVPYAIAPLESLPPFPSSDFTPAGDFTFSDYGQHSADSSIHFENLFNDDVSPPFLHLPNLKSIEQTLTVENTKPSFLSISPPPPQRRRLTPSHGGESKQKKISGKIRTLEKLMPWEKKMSLATILEEAHKYITFLQSQIDLLRWMPLESAICTTTTGEEEPKTDLLKSLTRQQILQVIANSPGARTVLYTRGVCVFSYEQMLSFKMMSQNARNP